MTQISGKIYQMKNAAGTENRFPRTVIEAVYGLSSYLQQQFASLADIYMPIEGISEALTGQEFVYRISPNTIKAKSLTLDRILGKSLAWNQLNDYSDYANGSANNVTWSRNDDEVTVVIGDGGPSAGMNITFIGVSRWYTPGHKFYFACNPNFTLGAGTVRFGYSSQEWFSVNSAVRSWTAAAGSGVFGLRVEVGAAAGTYKIKFSRVTDLTLLYGSAIDGMSYAEILAKFESEYPGYHEPSAGKLISNDASALETVGFNQWDEQAIAGYHSSSSGAYSPANDQITTKNPILVFAGKEYYCNKACTWYYYDTAMNFLSAEYKGSAGVVTIPSGARYAHLGWGAVYGPTYNHDICINLSDASRNGQYEPYWKRTLPLNLNNIKVKSHNIWDEEREGGAIRYSDGAKVDSQSSNRTKNPIKVKPSTAYYFSGIFAVNSGSYGIAWYDKDDVFITGSGQTLTAAGIVTSPANAYYLRATMSVTGGDGIINVSSSFNGQYEPHGILTITGGLKGNGDWADYIVGNKYVKRVGSVDLGDFTWTHYSQLAGYNYTLFNGGQKVPASSNIAPNAICNKYLADKESIFNAQMTADKVFTLNANTLFVMDSALGASGSPAGMLYYELATPIEYELAEPLVPTVKAGTTEARISPNADGLSAPFRADMTYSAQENNDSASSQYAAVAGRLLNPQTIWGQTFDGSSPVTGALTGVTTINGTAIQINSSGNVGIGTAATTAKLKVNGEINCGGITCGGEAIFTDGIELDSTASYKIWYDDEYNRIVFTVPNGDYLYSNGGIVSASYITAGASASSSDISLKTNVLGISGDKARAVIASLKPCEWDWNDKNEYLNGKHCAGLVAQEVEKVLPFAVVNEGKYLSLNYNVLHAYELALAQNHEIRIAQLEKENAELRNKLNIA